LSGAPSNGAALAVRLRNGEPGTLDSERIKDAALQHVRQRRILYSRDQ